MTEPLLEVQNLRMVYAGHGRDVEAIGDLSFACAAGELLAIVGPSGAGKTTLLRCVAGLLPPTSGEVVLGGARVDGPPPGLAVVFQDYGRSLFPWLTAWRNVALPLVQKKLPRAHIRRQVEAALREVGLADAHAAYPWQLSGGMQQRVAIARAIACEPKIRLMDEPFAAVDAQTRADLEDLTRRLWASHGATILLVTHDIDEAVYLGNRVLVLSRAPTRVALDLPIDLGAGRDQLATRSSPRFAALRAAVYGQIQRAQPADDRARPG
ncbi:MAG TPA: ABC transporter ATP-binding protein [Kofleriaceae bacterium]|nr:ABC transporter ATP-binding protein [Kofleriaceae bacterium]